MLTARIFSLATSAMAALAVAGCACNAVNLGTSDGGGARPDGGRRYEPGDPCGNGVDDDGDGRIDDGCPCGPGETQACFGGPLGERGVGACSDGVQHCVTSLEWGDWGNAPCGGDVVASREMCDGADHDCDGAIDEDCPCVAGDTSPCGAEFLVGECRAGTQVCGSDGRWSGCDGAIGPRAEVCDNGLDEDCDGMADELCGCLAEPERCRDGVDNDCDGTTDEPACSPDWPPDAGTPMCGIEECDNAIDDDCDERIDETVCECALGECPARTCDCTTSTRGWTVLGEATRRQNGTGIPEQQVIGLALNDRDGEIGVLYGAASFSMGRYLSYWLLRTDLDGRPIARATEIVDAAPVYSGDTTPMIWTGSRYVFRVTGPDARLHLRTLGADGSRGDAIALGEPSSLDRSAEGVALLRDGDDIVVTWSYCVSKVSSWQCGAAVRWLQRFDDALVPRGPPLRIAEGPRVPSGRGTLVRSPRGLFYTTAYEHDTRVTSVTGIEVGQIDEGRYVETMSYDIDRDHRLVFAALAFGRGQFLSCYHDQAGGLSGHLTRCRRLDATGAPIDVDFGPVSPMGNQGTVEFLGHSGCRFVAGSSFFTCGGTRGSGCPPERMCSTFSSGTCSAGYFASLVSEGGIAEVRDLLVPPGFASSGIPFATHILAMPDGSLRQVVRNVEGADGSLATWMSPVGCEAR